MQTRSKIVAQVFMPQATNRLLVDEPLTADDWRKVWEVRKGFVAAVRQIVCDARCRETSKKK